MIPLADFATERFIRMKRSWRYGKILGFDMDTGAHEIEFLNKQVLRYLSNAFDYVSEEEYVVAWIMKS